MTGTVLSFRPMATAPKGTWVEKPLPGKKGVAGLTHLVHVPEWILTASKCRRYILTQWIPEQSRWNCYSEKEEPLGWTPVPEMISEAVG